MPLDEKEKTAYHEAGHCFRGWEYRFFAVHDTCIYEQPAGKWWGQTPIRRSGFRANQRTQIALAGLLAEAKAVATDAAGELRQVGAIGTVAASIAQLYITQNIPVAGRGVKLPPDDAWPIEIPINRGDPVTAYVTLSDLAEIPLDHRDVVHLGEALDGLADFVNDAVSWAAIQAIASELVTYAPGCLGHFFIYGIIKTATSSLLPDEP